MYMSHAYKFMNIYIYEEIKIIFLLGEGVDDHGGPYRAAFHTALGEEPAGLLGLLSPSMNSKTGTGTAKVLIGTLFTLYSLFSLNFLK
jgi:hypothetical protein